MSMAKTPVSVLNEYLMKKGVVPKFDLISDGYNTHQPTFACIVQCLEHQTIGRGRSKQEAKHEAAKNMLSILKVTHECEYQEEVEQLIVPNEDSLRYNAVGALAEYCKKTSDPDAVYLVTEAGPPHLRVFTVKCCVSQLSTCGVSRTKKQAKHIAAHKMLTLLQIEDGKKPMEIAVPKKSEVKGIQDVDMSNLASAYQPQSLRYRDFCNAYLDLPEKSQTIADVVKNFNIVKKETACELLCRIADELTVQIFVEKISQNGYEKLPADILKSESIVDICDIKHLTLEDSEENDISIEEDEEESLDELGMGMDMEMGVDEDVVKDVGKDVEQGAQEMATNGSTLFVVTLQLLPPVVAMESTLSGASYSLLEYLNILCK